MARIVRRRRQVVRRRFLKKRFSTNEHHFIRSVISDITLANASASIAGAFSWQLNTLGNVAEFTSLYDQYRIDKINILILPAITSSDDVAGPNIVPRIYYAIDIDDSVAPNLNELLQYGTMKTKMLTHPVRMSITRPATVIDAAGIDRIIRSPILDMGNIATPMRGIKWYVETSANVTQDTYFRVVTQYHFTCFTTR